MTSVTCLLATFAGSGLAQTNWGSTGAVTVALTMTYRTEALQLKDETGKVLSIANGGGPTFENSFSQETVTTVNGGEPYTTKVVTTEEYGSKLGSWKYGNKEIIESLVEDQTLPQIGKDPFIAGWSIIMTYNADGAPTGAVARHTSKVNVPLNMGFTSNFQVDATSSKIIRTDNSPLNGEPTSTETRSLTKTYKASAQINVPFMFGDIFTLSGLLTGGSKVTPKTEGTGIDKITTFVYPNTATKLDKVIGVSSFEDLIEGTISVAAGVIVDMDDFNATPF